MNDILYQDTLKGIVPEKLNGFFIGWPNPPTPKVHFAILENSSAFVLAVDERTEQVIGFITAVSDGILAAYIPLLEVLPEYQNRGIGTLLVDRMLEKLDDIYMIDLMCDAELQPYYEQLGLTKANGMIKRNYHRQSGRIGPGTENGG